MQNTKSILIGCFATIALTSCTLVTGDPDLVEPKKAGVGGKRGIAGASSDSPGGGVPSAGQPNQSGGMVAQAGADGLGGVSATAGSSATQPASGASSAAGSGTTVGGGGTVGVVIVTGGTSGVGAGGATLGGASTGVAGAVSTGGRATGGTTSAAGAAVGGATTGGMATGGTATGGAATGGAATGGAATGGAPPTVKSIALGAYHSCAVYTNGTAKCWGENYDGRLGNGLVADTSTPVVVPLTNVQSISAGWYHTCALLTDGTVKCWGSNSMGTLGDGSTVTSSPTPVAVKNLTNITNLAVGMSHSCAVASGGTVYCWGMDTYGALGDGTATTTSSNVPVPVTVAGGANSAASSYHTCVVNASGWPYCWGKNESSQVGDGSTTDRTTPYEVTSTVRATAIDAGAKHTCMLLNTQAIQCWGANAQGQLGNGDSSVTKSTTPVTVTGITAASALSTLLSFSCAIDTVGGAKVVKCWGENTWGELSESSYANRWSPVAVAGVGTPLAVSVGFHHACVLRTDGTVYCWGRNNVGQLGNGTTENSLVPAQVVGL